MITKHEHETHNITITISLSIEPLNGYSMFYIRPKLLNPSEIPSEAYVLQIQCFYSINHPGKIVSRSRNSTECVLHHSSRTVTPMIFFEELITRSQVKNRAKSISYSFFDSEVR